VEGLLEILVEVSRLVVRVLWPAPHVQHYPVRYPGSRALIQPARLAFVVGVLADVRQLVRDRVNEVVIGKRVRANLRCVHNEVPRRCVTRNGAARRAIP